MPRSAPDRGGYGPWPLKRASPWVAWQLQVIGVPNAMQGYSWNLLDIHGFDMVLSVLSLIIHFQVLFLDILGVECWWILEDRWSGEHYTLQFCIARSVVVHIRWENMREKNWVKGIYIICLIYKLHYSSGRVVEYDGCRWVEPGWSQTCEWQWYTRSSMMFSVHWSDGPSFFHPTDATLSTGPASCTVQNPSTSICLRQCWWCCSHGSP